MADAKRLMDSGDLVAARQALNPAITSGMLPENEQKLAMQLQAEINKTLVFSPRRLPNDDWIEAYTLKSGDMLQKIAPKYSITPKLVQRVNNITDARKIRAGQTLKMIKGSFHAVVTKHAFTMDIYLGAPGGEGSMYVCTLPVGLGLDNSTPAGTWHVEQGKKLVNPKYYDPHGGGVIEPDDPKNPLGEFWIGMVGVEGEAVGKTSYGIHGTIDPDSIGKMASQGCIRMHSEDIALVYDLLVEGKSTVVVKP
jgi:lipoprotein-anchoring transpeptidase ErfK/SrfK